MRKVNFKNTKHFVIGFIVGATILTTGNAFASTSLERIQAYLNKDLSIVYNDEKVSLANAPITYNGKTYLPLTDVGKLTNTNVKWNQAERSVEMTTNESQVANEELNFTILKDYYPQQSGYAIKIDEDIYVPLGNGSRNFGIFKETMYDESKGVYFTNNDNVFTVVKEPTRGSDAFFYMGSVYIKEQLLANLVETPEN